MLITSTHVDCVLLTFTKKKISPKILPASDADFLLNDNLAASKDNQVRVSKTHS